MEGWQKGAPAVLKMSASAKQNYFKQFPDREAWFHSNYPEHFGRSAAAATSSLKKVTQAKVKKQRLAAIRQAVEKRNQLKISSDAVRAMGQRRRESGEGLGGGLETNRELERYAAAGNYFKSGGLGSLYEQSTKNGVVQNDKGSFDVYVDGKKVASFTKQEQANDYYAKEVSKESESDISNDLAAVGINTGVTAADVLSKMKSMLGSNQSGSKDAASTAYKEGQVTPDGKQVWTKSGWISTNNLAGMALPPDRATGFRDPISGTSVDGTTPKPKESGRDPKWERLFKPESQGGGGNPNKAYMSDIDTMKSYIAQRQFRTPAEVDASVKARGIDPSVKLEPEELETAAKRKAQDAGYIEDKGMYYEDSKEFAKQLAQRIMEQKRLQECMPMPMNSMGEGGKSESEDEPGEYDYEGDMAKSQLRSIAYNSKMLHDMLEDNTNLPEWVQSKITLAEDYIMTAANYMRSEMNRMDEEVLREGASHWQYNGTLYPNGDEEQKGKPYTITVKRGDDLGDVLGGKHAFRKVSRENPHLEPHEVEAILNGSGEDIEDVEVEHEGKKYKHRIYNQQEPDMIYMDEEVEQVDEAKKRLKPSYWKAEWRLGTETEVDKNNQKIYNRLAKTDPEKAAAFQENLMKLKKKDMKEEVEQIEEGFKKSSPAHMKARNLVSRSSMKVVYHSDGSATIYTTGDKNVSSATKVDHIHRDAGLDYNNPASAYENSSKSKGGLKFKTKETDDGSHQVHISYKGMKEEVEFAEETEDVNAVHASMEKTMKKDMEEDLPFDPTGERKPGNVVDKSGAVHTPMSRVRHLAQMAAMRAEVSQQKPETAEDLVAQHQAMHTLEEKMNLETAKMGDVIKDFQKSDAPQFKGKSQEERRKMALAAKLGADRGSRMDEQMTLDQAKKDPRYMSDPAFKAEVDKAEAVANAVAAGFDRSNDMIKPSMLPDTPTIPQGQGFGDDIEAKKKEKILNKTKVAVSKKKDNYDMVNRGALPDMPPANMQEENEVVEQEVEEIEVPQEEVIQEPIQEQTPVSDNPYVAAAAGFLNNTSNRLLYGERK